MKHFLIDESIYLGKLRLLAVPVIFCFASVWFSPSAIAEKAPLSGIKFTKTEDLDPNKRSSTRTVKQKWAVVIGASKFKERRLANDNMMNYKAAKSFYRYLKDENGGRFTDKHIRMLVNTKATKDNILSTIGSSWLGRLAGPDDLVVVFISTSSFPTTDGSAYLCAYDCALDNVYGTCISMEDLMTTLKKNVKAERIVLILQASYSGAADLTAGAKSLSKSYNLDPDKLVAGTGYVIISSSKPNQMSWGNIFSSNLIDSLKRDNGMVSLTKAFARARSKTETDTTGGGDRYASKQTPVLKSDWKGKELVLGIPAVEDASELPAGVNDYLAAEAYYFRANNFLSQGNVDSAIREYKKAINTDPKYAGALADYATVLASKGQLKEAAGLFRRAIAERPNEALYRANYAIVLHRLGQVDECTSQLEKAYKLNPKDRVVLTGLASSLLANRDASGAAALLQEAVDLYPKSSSLHDRLSHALAKAGRLNSALKHAKQAVSLNPKSVTARINLGTTLMMDGNLSGATEEYKQAITMSPDNANAHYLLSKTYEKTGNINAARTELKSFIDLTAPGDPRRAKAQQRLAGM